MKKGFAILAAVLCCVQMSAGLEFSNAVICDPESVPWFETFTRDATGAVEPECWTVSSPVHQVWVVTDKTYDGAGNATATPGSEHLYASGGGPTTVQVFALPTFQAALNTLEVAFDYKHSYTGSSYGVLEVGYMTDATDAATFVALNTYPHVSNYTHAVCLLNNVPSTATHIAFRFAGGTSNFGGLSMDNFVVAPIGHSGEVDLNAEPVLDSGIYGLTYCEAQFTWFAYSVQAFGIGLFDADTQTNIAGILVTTGECDRFAYQDGVTFSEFEDYENKYYCSTKWILNVDEEGLSKGSAWDDCVINIGTAVSPVLGLKPGHYQVQIYKYTSGSSSLGDHITTIPFELTEKKVTNLQAVVADNKQTATVTWSQPELGNGERLYVSVRSGETVAYDNYENLEIVTSPLTVDVTEGRSYTATVQILDRNKNPLGAEVACDFTVGVNRFEPRNPHAEVFSGDNVTFSWEVDTIADFYDLVLFLDGAYYTTLSVRDTVKTTTMPKDGTWSWTVQAFTQGANGKYFPASNAIAGNDFVSKAADIPADAVVMNVWGMEAAYLDKNSGYYQEGKHGWMVMFATGEEGGTGYPMPTFLLYTNKENAISGVYNVARENIDLETCYLYTGSQATSILGTDADVRLYFAGYDDDKAAYGYRYGYYTGQFRLVGTDGKTYVGKFMELFCNSYNFSTMASSIRDHKGMWDEDPDYIAPQGLEDVQIDKTQSTKVLHDGRLYILLPDGTIFNAAGQRVK